jgi:pimeloyl-ACP methyl ester carboxylesterase
MANQDAGLIDRGDGVGLAWALRRGRGPTVLFLPGFASDMAGAKAIALDGFCAGRGQAMLRFDYSGHGASGGAFEDGTIGRWLADALCVIDHVTDDRLLLVGSSMGGWIGLHVALRRPERVVGLVGIAAAPDFTETLIWEPMPPARRARLLDQGCIEAPSGYGPPLRITKNLIADGRAHLLLGGPIGLHLPVRLLQGQRDPDVPWETALRLAERIEGADVQVTLIKDGDHRLSRPQDLDLLARTVGSLLGEDAA